MHIDWFTVAAQIGNFLLLIWLLKRFLYQPVLRGIDAREAEIARRLDEASQAQSVAAALQTQYQQRMQQLQQEQNAQVAAAMQQADDERRQLLERSHRQFAREREQWQQHLEREQEEFILQLELDATDTFVQLLRRALEDLADTSLEQAMARQVARQVQALADRGEIPILLAENDAATGAATEALVSSRTALSPEARDELQQQLAGVLPADRWRFVVDADQPPGLVLQIGSTRVSWTVESYLEELQALMAGSEPDRQARAKT